MTIKKIESIAIIGAGHLGDPLATSLATLDFNVIGTNTKKVDSKKNYFQKSFLLEDSFHNTEQFSNIDLFIISIPPSKIKYEDLKKFKESFNDKEFIFISSTSVFSNKQLNVDETITPRPESDRSRRLNKQESIFKNNTIIRCSGLISNTRHPIHSLLKRKAVLENQNLNLIHIDDVIEIIKITIQKKLFNEVIHATHINELLKKDYYDEYSIKYGLEKLRFKNSSAQSRKVLSKTLIDWKYKFKNDLF
jgi:hypothetical protein